MATPTYLPNTTTSKPRYTGAGMPGRGFTGGQTPSPTPAPTPYNSPNPAGFTPTPTGMQPGSGTFGQTPGTAPIPGVDPTGRTWGVDPTGTATPYTPTRNAFGGTDWTAGTGTNLWDLQKNRMLDLIGALRSGGGGPVSMNREPGLTLVDRETPSTMNDRVAAESAAFGRAKDRVGKLGKSAIDSLKDRMSSMGMAGSTAEARGVADVTNSAQGQLGEVIRQQAEDQLDRADTIDDRNVSVGITQRGQDIGQRATEYGGNIQQRGQDFQGAMNDPTRQMIMQMLSSFYGGGGGSFGMPRLY